MQYVKCYWGTGDIGVGSVHPPSNHDSQPFGYRPPLSVLQSLPTSSRPSPRPCFSSPSPPTSIFPFDALELLTRVCRKSSLLMVLDGKEFPAERPFVAECDHKQLTNAQGRPVLLGLVDYYVRGDSERLRPLAYPQTDVFALSFDISDPATLQSVQRKWLPEIRYHMPDTPIVLMGLKGRSVSSSLLSPLRIIIFILIQSSLS